MVKLFKSVDTVFDRVLSGTAVVAIVLLLMLAFFVTIQVFARYVLNIHIRGLFVYAQSALIIFPLLVAAYTLRKGEHVSADFLISHLSERAKAGLAIPVFLASLIFTVTLAWYTGQWAALQFAIGATKISEQLIIPVPMGVLGASMSFGCLLLTIEIIRQIVFNIRFLSSHERRTTSLGLRDNPWPWISVFVIAIVISGALLIYGNPVVAIAFLTVVILFSGMPIFLALGLSGAAGLYFFVGTAGLLQMPITAFQSMNSFALTALPLFIVGGLILEGAQVVAKVFKFFQLFAGRFTASPLLVVIAVGGFFCAVSGSTIAATAVVAAVAMPILIGQGYRKSLSSGVVAGSTVGTLIPPSIGFIIYGVITGESIAQLFFGGLVPAVVLFSLYIVYIITRATVSKESLFEKGQVPSQISFQRISWKDKLSALKDASWGLITPVFVLGGIYAGVFTPTEAAAVMVVYAIVVCIFVTRTLTWRGLLASLRRSCFIAAMILCIIITALILAAVVSQLRIGPNLVAFAQGAGLGEIEVLGLIFLTLFILGMFINASSVMVITLPVFFPLTLAVGINPLWLGVFYIIVLESGCLTPPVGVNLFAISGVSRIPLWTVVAGSWPFVGMMLLTVVIIYLFPELVTWLPSTMVR